MKSAKRLCVGVTGLFFSTCSLYATLILNTNLIVNPGAEAGPGTDILNEQMEPVPGWNTYGGFNVDQYTTIPDSIPTTTDPGPPDRGSNFFVGGPNENNPNPDHSSGASQILDVSDGASLIDQGIVLFSLSGWLGGYYNQMDDAKFTAVFLDANGNAIGSAMIGPVLMSDRVNANGQYFTGLLYRDTQGFIPVGTRSIDFELAMTWFAGEHNDGYADNLSFVATDPFAVPEPATAGLAGAGLLGLALFFRHRRK